MLRPVLIFTLLLNLSHVASAASFDCAKASTLREHTICSTPALSRLDDQLATAYAAARNQLSPTAAELIQSDQRAWLNSLDALCPPGAPKASNAADTPRCLTHEYHERLTQLTDKIQRIDGLIFFPRYQVIIVPGDKSSPETPSDPGFGYGTFLWPQIDHPTPAQQVWNSAIYQRLIKSAGGKNATSLASAVDETGYTYAFYQLTAANSTLIEVDLGISTYGWGAAHPIADISSIAFWLEQGRPLTLADLFRAGSQWQAGLTDIIIAKLNSNPGLKDTFWKTPEFRKAILAAIAAPSSWDISRDGMTIRFSQYAIGPYAIGMPEAKLPWKTLQPFLNPNLHPAQLPPPIPQTTN